MKLDELRKRLRKARSPKRAEPAKEPVPVIRMSITCPNCGTHERREVRLGDPAPNIRANGEWTCGHCGAHSRVSI